MVETGQRAKAFKKEHIQGFIVKPLNLIRDMGFRTEKQRSLRVRGLWGPIPLRLLVLLQKGLFRIESGSGTGGELRSLDKISGMLREIFGSIFYFQ
jgi:hypothetical protein